MTLDELQTKIDTLCENTEFTDKLAACENTEAMAVLLKSQGVDISESELSGVFAAVSVQSNDEMSENALDAVSGGSIISALYALYKTLRKKKYSSGGGGTGSFGGGGGGGR